LQRRPAELKLPTDPLSTQVKKREAWNNQRRRAQANFFTVGYSGRSISEVLHALTDAGVQCLIDVRSTPVSMYKPDFSKGNLSRHLAHAGMEYLHLPDLGVPRDIRGLAIGKADRNEIWDWYDANVAVDFGRRNLHRFFNIAEHPVAFMCTELDPTSCHRHRLCLALELNGLFGFDV
jgi:uncharacterized protein (DUF488 family)